MSMGGSYLSGRVVFHWADLVSVGGSFIPWAGLISVGRFYLF